MSSWIREALKSLLIEVNRGMRGGGGGGGGERERERERDGVDTRIHVCKRGNEN